MFRTTSFVVSHRASASAVVLSAVLLGCGGPTTDAPTQVAAKVNRQEVTVHQVNQQLQGRRGLSAEQLEAASRQALELLIEQELAVQQAKAAKLDRDPRVLMQLEVSRREILARAYRERVAAGAARPTDAEIRRYFESQPALFAERRVYTLHEMRIEATPPQVEAIKAQLRAGRSVAQVIDFLKTNGLAFVGQQVVRTAEQLPAASLSEFSHMKDGQTLLTPVPGGAQWVVLAGSRLQPMDEQRARPQIEQFLRNQATRTLIESDTEALRTAAKVEYMGAFAASVTGGATPVGSAASAPLDTSNIRRGLGLK